MFSKPPRAGEFAAELGFLHWGRLAGLWHDLGKYAPAFQAKLGAVAGAEAHLETRARVDHSTAGALYAFERFEKTGFGTAGRLLAYIAAGHHAGLPDWEADTTGRAALVFIARTVGHCNAQELLEKAMLTVFAHPPVTGFGLRLKKMEV